MKNNEKENQPFIYIRATGEKIPVAKEVRDVYYNEAARIRMKAQAHGQCVCPQSKVWVCDGDCLVCEYRRSGDMASLDVPIGEDGSEGKLLAADYGLPMFELYGAGATDYVLSSGGVKDGDAGFYYAPIAALRDLPEGLGMRQAQAETLALAPADAEWVLVYPNDDSEVPQP